MLTIKKRGPTRRYISELVGERPLWRLVEYWRMSWKILPLFLNITWKYQHPPRGLTGDSIPWLLPLMTLIDTGPSGPSGYAVGILNMNHFWESKCWTCQRGDLLIRSEFLVWWILELLRFLVRYNTMLCHNQTYHHLELRDWNIQ